MFFGQEELNLLQNRENPAWRNWRLNHAPDFGPGELEKLLENRENPAWRSWRLKHLAAGDGDSCISATTKSNIFFKSEKLKELLFVERKKRNHK